MSRSTSVIAHCLNPPDIAELDAAQPLPPWILLETRVYFARRGNASTTARAQTSRGHELEVSICVADPPALSYLCLHCPTLSPTSCFVGEPRVIRSERQLLLLHLPFTWTTSGVLKRSNEYYVYHQAIHGQPPRLSRIPDPKPCLLLPDDLGIYCADAASAAGGGEYVVAGLCPTRDAQAHELHLYSSKTNAWTMSPARLEDEKFEERLPVTPHKVIPLGGGLLGWVDIWKGVLVCDVLSRRRDSVLLRFIPFPPRLPGNPAEHLCPWKFRDVTCANGSLKFVEIEHSELVVQPAVDKSLFSVAADLPDTIYDDDDDSDPLGRNDDLDMKPPGQSPGWRSVIWNRVLSETCWRMGCNVRSGDILPDNQSPSALAAAGNSHTIDLLPSFPNLSIHGDDVVHMKSLVRVDRVLRTHMISVDMRSSTLKTLVPCTPAKLDAYCPHFPCVLPNHLSNTPDLPEVVQASNSENVNAAPPQIIQASHSQNITENECPRSCAHDVIGVPSQSQNGGSNVAFSLAPQQSFGSWDTMSSYNMSHHEYADGTHPIYGNNQWSWPWQQQPTYPPNWAPRPSWFSPGSVNVHPAYPVFNSPAYGPMTHPSPSQPFVPPTPFQHTVAVNTTSSGWPLYWRYSAHRSNLEKRQRR